VEADKPSFLVLAAAIASPAQDDQASPDVVKFKTVVKFGP
jgi:hypothetical protein